MISEEIKVYNTGVRKEKPLRLAKYLAEQGVASRRKSEALIAQGRVAVNGQIINEQGWIIDPGQDQVTVDGQLIQTVARVYILLNKPAGYISSTSDPQGRPLVTDLVKVKDLRIYPVGRLDFATEGLLLMTNDGDFANFIIHPRYEIEKKYEVLVENRVSDRVRMRLQKGILLEDGMTAPAVVRIIKYDRNQTWLEIVIHEGRKRQVRRMFEAAGHQVIHLKRTALGFLTLEGVKTGEYRYLNPREIKQLMALSQKNSYEEQ